MKLSQTIPIELASNSIAEISISMMDWNYDERWNHRWNYLPEINVGWSKIKYSEFQQSCIAYFQ